MGDAKIQRARLPAIRFGEDPHTRLGAVTSARLLIRVVLRAIIDDYDLSRSAILLREQAVDGLADHLLFVVRRDDHAHRWKVGRRDGPILMPLETLDERKRADDHEAPDAENDGDGEDPEEQPFENPEQAKPADEKKPLHTTHGIERWHGLLARQTGELRDEDEGVAPSSERIDERAERGERIGAVATAIMQQHDVARRRDPSSE